MMDRRNFLRTASSFTLLTVGATTDASRTTGESIGKYLNLDKLPGMCAKEPMTADGIIRLSKIEVYPQYLDKYINYATEVGEISLRNELGVLTMYAIGEKENPCNITIRRSIRLINSIISYNKTTMNKIFLISVFSILTLNVMAQEKIVQTTGRTQLGEFAPKFAELNDDVLFGEVWSRTNKLGLRDRSLVTVTSHPGWTDAYRCSRTRLVSGRRQAGDRDSTRYGHPYPG